MTKFNIDAHLAERAKGREPSPIRAIFPLLSIPGMISFGGGYPNPSTFPFAGMKISFKGGQEVQLEENAIKAAIQYGPSNGNPDLVAELIEWHKFKDGLELTTESLVVLNGAQEGLFITGFLFLESDDTVVLSEPTYPGALSAFSAFTKNYIPIPLDEQGIDVGRLSSILDQIKANGEKIPKLIYTIPNGHNPGGVALSEDRRRKMVKIANEHDILILEDDPYQLLNLEDAPCKRSLQSLDQEGRVIRLDSFSKIFAPGVRVGYASGAKEMMQHFILFKQAANLHTSSLSQQILAAYLTKIGVQDFHAEIHEKCRLYRKNRDNMVDAARSTLPKEVGFNVPNEGFFIWFTLPDYCDAEYMVQNYSKDLKVLLVPGPAFSSSKGCKNCMRASFSMVDQNSISSGMEKFAEMIRREKTRQLS